MTGKPIGSAFETLASAGRKDLFSGLTVRRVQTQAMTAEQANEYTKKLLALGYLSGAEAKSLAPVGGDAPGMTEGAWNSLGLYERESKKNPRLAREAFEKAIALAPGYHSPMFNMAVLYRQQKQFDKAEDWLFRALSAGHPDPEGTIENWVVLLRADGEDAAERRLLERAAKQYPQNERLARELGLARFRAKDYPGAEAAVEAFVAATQDPDTLNASALFQTSLGRKPEAVALFERSLTLRPGQPAVIRALQMLRGEAPVPHP